MNVTMLQEELQRLPPDQQDRICAFLTTLRMKRDGLISEITRRLDDTSEQRWIAWEDVKKDLDLSSSEDS